MRVWEKDRYFRTSIAEDFTKKEIKTIGVYVFSDGAATDAKSQGPGAAESLDLFNSIFTSKTVALGR